MYCLATKNLTSPSHWINLSTLYNHSNHEIYSNRTMSRLQYSSYPGLGVQNLQNQHYNQAVRIPAGADKVEIAGQGKYRSPIANISQERRPSKHHPF